MAETQLSASLYSLQLIRSPAINLTVNVAYNKNNIFGSYVVAEANYATT